MKDKFWAIIKVNGVTDLHKDDGKLVTFATERDAEAAAQTIANESQGKICAIVVEGKTSHKWEPFVKKTILTVVEAEVARSSKITVEAE